VKNYSLSHLADSTLLLDLKAIVVRDRITTAEMLAHIAEVDARRLYAADAYPSMFAYCVGELHLCEQAAFKRIRAARTARKFPVVFEAVADGRLHLTAVVLLTPYLAEETVDDLLAIATHKSKSEVERLLAERFPQPDALASIRAIPASSPGSFTGQLSPGTVEQPAPGRVDGGYASGWMDMQLSPGTVETYVDRPKVKPLAPQRFSMQFTVGQVTHDKLRNVEALAGHPLQSADLESVFERGLDALALQLEKRKFAATSKPPRGQRRASHDRRHVPAHVKRAVWEHDNGQCTFVSKTGRRCPAYGHLEFDHVNELARGGEATVSNIRLLCRAHNQYLAEHTYGAGFMNEKRREAAQARAAAKARIGAAKAKAREVIPYLRLLGFTAGEAREAAARCESIPDAPLEERVRFALSLFNPAARRRCPDTSAGRLPGEGVHAPGSAPNHSPAIARSTLPPERITPTLARASAGVVGQPSSGLPAE
jgi:hypothetical protein